MEDRWSFKGSRFFIPFAITSCPSASSPLSAIPYKSPIPFFPSSSSSSLPSLSLGLSCCIYENKTLDYVHLIFVRAPSETSYIRHGFHRPNDFWYEARSLMDDCTLKVWEFWWRRCWCRGLVADWSLRLACKQQAVILDMGVINMSVGSWLIVLFDASVLFGLSLQQGRSGCQDLLCLGLLDITANEISVSWQDGCIEEWSKKRGIEKTKKVTTMVSWRAESGAGRYLNVLQNKMNKWILTGLKGSKTAYFLNQLLTYENKSICQSSSSFLLF